MDDQNAFKFQPAKKTSVSQQPQKSVKTPFSWGNLKTQPTTTQSTTTQSIPIVIVNKPAPPKQSKDELLADIIKNRDKLEETALLKLGGMPPSKKGLKIICFMWTLEKTWNEYVFDVSGNQNQDVEITNLRKLYNISANNGHGVKDTICAEENLLAIHKDKFVFSLAYILSGWTVSPLGACGYIDPAGKKHKCKKLLEAFGITDLHPYFPTS